VKRALLLLLLLCSVCKAQNTNAPKEKTTPRIHVSGEYSDMQYLKEQIPVVDYVIDRKDADVHVLVVKEGTGSGGYLYSLFFYGKHQFDKINDTIKVVVNLDDSNDLTRNKVVKGIKTGLFNYLKNSSVSNLMTIAFQNNKAAVKEKDPWDFWLFNVSLSGYFNGESASSYTSLYGTLSTSRTTEDLRLGFGFSNSYSQNTYDYDDYNYLAVKRIHKLYANAVKSVSDHWSIGSWGNIYRSSYSNYDLSWTLTGGVEYNFYPYSQSSQQQLRLAYRMGITHNKYFEETVYFKEAEYLATQTLSLTLNLTQPWGSVIASIDGQNFFQDLKKYCLDVYIDTSLKLYKGLSITSYFGYSKMNNQISLARGGASVEDVLLSTRQLETEYTYYASIGLSFSFGSIFNSIVNPRFGN
jgi:hypothetical protein